MYRLALKILRATVGIETDNKKLLPHLPFTLEVKSLLTDFHRIDPIPYTDDLDGYIRILESPEAPRYERQGRGYIFSGPFEELSRSVSDPRFSFWGNQGFLYRYALYLLEKHHKIYNLHACALFDQKYHAGVKVGNSFKYSVDGDSKSYVGEISKIYPQVSIKNRKIKAEVEVRDFMSGLFGDGYIVVPDKK